MSIDKFEIREQVFTYTDRNGTVKTGSKFSVWNKRTNRKLRQHASRVLAEARITEILQRKTINRLSKKFN